MQLNIIIHRYTHYPVTVICGAIDAASFGSDILSKIYAGLVAYEGHASCKINQPLNISETSEGWAWQVCLHIYK